MAKVEEKGEPAQTVLGESLANLIAGIRFNKSMRWNVSGVAFSRPIRWLIALHGENVVPFSYAGLSSSSESRGLRFDESSKFMADSPSDYLAKIQSQGIILDQDQRKAEIKKQADALAVQAGGHIPDDPDLLTEITNLVERPTAFLGTFDKAYLEILPPEVLVSVMKKHQRYFVIQDDSGNLLPNFVAVRNGGDQHLDIVADGNEQVILARFDDAQFFVKKDLQEPLETFVDDLNTLTFQVKLGSFLDKTRRIQKLVQPLGDMLALTIGEMATAKRAAELCKADLATNMVVEMTSLQGVMGRYYALHSGETPEVADAIFEHYLPRSSNDRIPEKKPGLVIGLADRLDSLMGLFAIGQAPTGTKDPFAQRRAALGICQNLIEWQQSFDLERGLSAAAQGLDIEVSLDDIAACLEFIQGRLRGMLLDMGFSYDVVDAILAEKGNDPYRSFVGVKTLSGWVAREDWSEILQAFSRCVRITRDQEEMYQMSEGLFEEDSERLLYRAVVKTEQALEELDTDDAFLNAFLPIIPVINRFFDEVLVMAEDESTRKNRLGLLQRVSALSSGVVDMSYLEGF
jgi:glycyl-tRNA synthetase